MVNFKITRSGQWNTTTELMSTLTPKAKKTLGMTTKHVAEALVEEMKKNIRKGREEWPALSPLTTSRKGHSRPLIDTRRLLRAIKVRKGGPNEYFAGVSNNEKTASGVSMTIVAHVHEYGAKIRPKKAKRLAIPISKAAMKLVARYKSLRDIPGLFRPVGTNVLAIKTGKNKFKIMFILRRRITIKKRPFIAPAYIAVYKDLDKIYLRSLKLILQGK